MAECASITRVTWNGFSSETASVFGIALANVWSSRKSMRCLFFRRPAQQLVMEAVSLGLVGGQSGLLLADLDVIAVGLLAPERLRMPGGGHGNPPTLHGTSAGFQGSP
jgi:hypothetical protein